MANCLFDIYKDSIMPHVKHMCPTAYEIVMEKMCAYKSSNYALTHWKCVYNCCL